MRSLEPEEVLSRLLAMPEEQDRERFLRLHIADLNDEFLGLLKSEADRQLRIDLDESLRMVALMHSASAVTEDPAHEALALLAEANALSIGLGEYRRAVSLYDSAAALYAELGLETERARAQIGKVGALSHLGLIEEARQAGRWASRILESAEMWLPLAVLTMNLGIMHSRIGDDTQALRLFDRAAELYLEAGEDGEAGWVWVQHNRAVALRNIGEFEPSLGAAQLARDRLMDLGQTIEAARAEQAIAITMVSMGNFNEALKHLDRAKREFLSDGRRRDATLVDLYAGDCLLQLRRLESVVEKCRALRSYFTERGAGHVVGQSFLLEAIALLGLQRFDDAAAALIQAREIFGQEGSLAWSAACEVEQAVVHKAAGKSQQALRQALECAERFQALNMKLDQARALLVAAQSAHASGNLHQAKQLASEVLEAAKSSQWTPLIHQSATVLGEISIDMGDLELAESSLLLAIDQLEQLRGGIMVEHRPSYVEDKYATYLTLVGLYLQIGEVDQALDFAERAKSRALLDLIAFRINLGLEVRSEEDRPFVERILELRDQRDRAYRRWQTRRAEDPTEAPPFGSGDPDIARQVASAERQIKDHWHQLLIRNADYAKDAALWTVRTEPIRPYLSESSVLLEYVSIGDMLHCFSVTPEETHCTPLEVSPSEVERELSYLWLNFDSVAAGEISELEDHTRNAKSILGTLHGMLLEPLLEQLAERQRLIIVPTSVLHYLPFHALFDGRSFLVKSHTVSYLPAAGLLRHCAQLSPAGNGALVVANSSRERLSFVISEAHTVAEQMGADTLIEEQASRESVLGALGGYRAIHIAAHGEFRADNPLFSGLELQDSWLTTFDIFNTRLDTSLVVLSGCETGRNVVAGGDEIMGISRAFLYAGSSSLVLSLWRVSDQSTAQLMQDFYRRLQHGQPKAEALRSAQRSLIEASTSTAGFPAHGYEHPFFWAPFVLVGDTGRV